MRSIALDTYLNEASKESMGICAKNRSKWSGYSKEMAFGQEDMAI